jgi:Protein of unknown function (DUF3455)
LSAAPRKLVAGLVALLAGCAGMPENMAPPPLPTAVRVPVGHRHTMTFKSVGTLNYECRPHPGMSGAYGWVLDAPDAELLHWTGLRAGRYYAGPTLEHRDGSRVRLKLVGSSPDAPGKLPIHLYEAAGRSDRGALASVTFVQRLNAVARPPGSACAEGEVGRAARARFSADFILYEAR